MSLWNLNMIHKLNISTVPFLQEYRYLHGDQDYWAFLVLFYSTSLFAIWPWLFPFQWYDMLYQTVKKKKKKKKNE